MVEYIRNFAAAMELNNISVARIILEGVDITETMKVVQAEFQAKFCK